MKLFKCIWQSEGCFIILCSFCALFCACPNLVVHCSELYFWKGRALHKYFSTHINLYLFKCLFLLGVVALCLSVSRAKTSSAQTISLYISVKVCQSLFHFSFSFMLLFFVLYIWSAFLFSPSLAFSLVKSWFSFVTPQR